MKLRSEAHKALSLLFCWDKFLPATICDYVKEIILGKLNRKLKDALWYLRQTEPITPWSNAAEREINELKKGSGRKLIKSGGPKRLWDDCLELKSYVTSITAHSMYKLDGEAPETIMSIESFIIASFVNLSGLNGLCYKIRWHHIWMMILNGETPRPKYRYWSCHDGKDDTRGWPGPPEVCILSIKTQ